MILLTPHEILDAIIAGTKAFQKYERVKAKPTTRVDKVTRKSLLQGAQARYVAKAQAEKDEQENADATTDYAEGKISVEKWAERLGVNVYDLLAALNEYERS